MGWAVRVAHKPRKPKVEKNRKLSVWFDTDKAAGRGGEKDGALPVLTVCLVPQETQMRNASGRTNIFNTTPIFLLAAMACLILFAVFPKHSVTKIKSSSPKVTM